MVVLYQTAIIHIASLVLKRHQISFASRTCKYEEMNFRNILEPH